MRTDRILPIGDYLYRSCNDVIVQELVDNGTREPNLMHVPMRNVNIPSKLPHQTKCHMIISKQILLLMSQTKTSPHVELDEYYIYI